MKTGNLIPMAPKTELQINKASQIRGADMHRRLGRYKTCHEFSNWSELQYPSKFCELHGMCDRERRHVGRPRREEDGSAHNGRDIERLQLEMCRCDQIIAGRASSGRIAGSVLRITRGRRAPRHQQGDARVTARLPARLPARFPGLRIFAITVIHGGEELVHEQDPPARHDAGHGHRDAVTSQGHAAASNKRANAAVQKGTNDCAPGVV